MHDALGTQGFPERDMTSASDEIKTSLVHEIAAGKFPVGTWLPSCRALASELGVNRNTVNKVYQDLARVGVLEVVPGRGYRVVKQPDREHTAVPSVMRRRLLAAARDARLAGVGHGAFILAAKEIADMLYLHGRPMIACVECNDQDSKLLASELEASLSESVEPLLLADLERSPEELVAKYDIICTTLYHLTETQALAGSSKHRVVAVHAPPDAQALLELVRLDPSSRVGVVCEQPRTREYLKAAIGMVFDGDVRICLMSEREALQEIAHSVDVLVDVPSCHERISSLFPDVRTLTVGFHLDSKSLSEVRAKVAELHTERTRDLIESSSV